MPIYLDSAATTRLAPEIAQSMTSLLGQAWANPASQHASGRRAKAALEDARDRIKAACCQQSGNRHAYQPWTAWQVVFTSGGTEANNLAVHGLASAKPDHPAPQLLIAATEHPSILAAATESPILSSHTTVVPIDPETGWANIDALDQLLAQAKQTHPGRALVSIMAGNNETGILADLDSVSTICRRHDALLHSDAVQAFGKVAPEDLMSQVDAMTISAHKLHGPVGIGALLVRSDAGLRPMFFGGSQQLGLRPGSESVVMAAALAQACEMAEQHRAAGGALELARLRNRFESLLELSVPDIQFIGRKVERLPHISSVAFPGADRQALFMALDLEGVQCSTGSACASGSSQPSHVLAAMKLPVEWVRSTLRFSFSRFTTEAEIDQAVAKIAAASQRVRSG
jgi:cysteine desulfurase